MNQATPKKKLTNLNLELGETEKDKDAEHLKSILSDNLRFRSANGTIVDKAIFWTI